MSISSCTISGNSARDLGGGGVHVWEGSVTIDSCTISGNTASEGHRKTGGGVLVWAGTVSIVNSQLNSNQVANGGGVYISGGTVTLSSCNITGNTAGFALGYRDIPQVAFTANATIATTDAGKHFYSTQSTDYILTIANNASQGFATGAAITVINQGTGNITVAQGSGVTLYLAGNATSGNRTVATFGMATIMKVATDTWFINGTGVS